MLAVMWRLNQHQIPPDLANLFSVEYKQKEEIVLDPYSCMKS